MAVFSHPEPYTGSYQRAEVTKIWQFVGGSKITISEDGTSGKWRGARRFQSVAHLEPGEGFPTSSGYGSYTISLWMAVGYDSFLPPHLSQCTVWSSFSLTMAVAASVGHCSPNGYDYSSCCGSSRSTSISIGFLNTCSP
eukprot:Gb_06765 [translate_table: standard]